jgi:alpha-D-ribose 1-methylphosphonate 5-triphosphate synthase subunit PhnH
VAGLIADEGWRLTGPGIQHEHHLRVLGAPADFVSAWARNQALFPRGVDVLLCAGDSIAALPRSVMIAEG